MKIRKYKYEKPKKYWWFIIPIFLSLNIFIIWLIIELLFVKLIVKFIFLILLISFLYVEYILIKITLTYKNRGIKIINNNKITLPYDFKYTYPNKVRINEIPIDKIEVIQRGYENNIIEFLNNNKISFSDFYMVDSYEYNKNPNDFIVLKINIDNTVYIILRKDWFHDNIKEFLNYIS